jgi:hypothetical protein
MAPLETTAILGQFQEGGVWERLTRAIRRWCANVHFPLNLSIYVQPSVNDDDDGLDPG